MIDLREGLFVFLFLLVLDVGGLFLLIILSIFTVAFFALSDLIVRMSDITKMPLRCLDTMFRRIVGGVCGKQRNS